MKNMNNLKAFLTIPIILLYCSVSAQDNFESYMQELMTTEFENRVYSNEEIIEDFDFFIKSMEEVCPYPYFNSDSTYINNLTAKLKSKGPRNGKSLYLDFMELTAAFGVGHIFTYQPSKLYATNLAESKTNFPIKIKSINDEWIVKESLDSKLNDYEDFQIISINKQTKDELISSFAKYVPPAERSKESFVLNNLGMLFWLKDSYLEYNFIFLDPKTGNEIKVSSKGTKTLTVANYLDNEKKVSDFIKFKSLSEKVAYLELTSFAIFNENVADNYLKKVDSIFSELNINKVENLIIDLSKNGGGRGYFVDYILNYITNKPYRQAAGKIWKVSEQDKEFLKKLHHNSDMPPFIVDYMNQPIGSRFELFDDTPEYLSELENRFKGNIYCLISNSTYSAAMMMANAIEDFNLGLLIGTETGGVPNELSDILPIKTPNSNISFAVPTTMFVRANGNRKNKYPVLPNIEITDDNVIDKTIKIIEILDK